ncbi:hypothetical protein QQP08_018891 [Theobroma cacao]|nr:hypothetical protein QQP08_018891 [Theobroma cacao]
MYTCPLKECTFFEAPKSLHLLLGLKINFLAYFQLSGVGVFVGRKENENKALNLVFPYVLLCVKRISGSLRFIAMEKVWIEPAGLIASLLLEGDN